MPQAPRTELPEEEKLGLRPADYSKTAPGYGPGSNELYSQENATELHAQGRAHELGPGREEESQVAQELDGSSGHGRGEPGTAGA